ncbi:MAG: hypothetical protein V4739_18950 [Pseudomonadota bacterium]
MSEQHRRIAALLESEADAESLSGMVRTALKSNKDEMALVAKLVAAGKSPAARNNQLAKLRMIMSRVCKELGLPRYTVVENGTGYAVQPVARKNDPRRYSKVSDGLKELVEQVELLTTKEQKAITEEFRAALRQLEAVT